MPEWSKPYLVRRATRILSFAVRQNYTKLEIGGEACFLLKRLQEATEHFQWAERRVPTITVSASAFSADPDTGMLRYLLWQAGRDPVNEFPDVYAFTTTVSASASTDVWEPAVDKYTFIADRKEYAFDIFQDQLDSAGDRIADSVYVVFNTPPFMPNNRVIFNFGTINPKTNFAALQPYRDNQPGFQRSLFGFQQYINPTARIRSKIAPNRMLLAFPGTLTDVLVTDAGFIREAKADYWTTPPPYSPKIVEHDVIVRESTNQRYQVTNYTPIYLEDILVSQHFDMSELDPRSSLYSIDIED